MTNVPLGPFTDDLRFETAASRDRADPLARFRDRFQHTDASSIYLDGNSLGRLPLATIDRLADVVTQEWGSDLIASWGRRWWTLARDIGAMIAPIIGAHPEAVVVADSTSVGLYKLAVGALRARPGRTRIITDSMNFPTDLYVLSAAKDAVADADLVVVESDDDIEAPNDALMDALSEDTALLSLSHVAFKSGYLYDMERLTRAAHDVGALVLWDLSHSAGVVPMDLTNVDLAVGCTYKYLNGGPGSPAFIYVNPSLSIDNPLSGWWGHADPFAFELDYQPTSSVSRFQTGTMPILSLSAIEPAVQIIAEAGLDAIRAKSVALTDYLIELCDQELTSLGFTVASPRLSSRRGSHISLRHDDAWRIAQAMVRDAKLIPDFREPDNLRIGLAPLYTSFMDIHTAVHRIVAVVRSGAVAQYSERRDAVT